MIHLFFSLSIIITYVQGHQMWYVSYCTPQKAKITFLAYTGINKGNNKITELRAILQRESQNL